MSVTMFAGTVVGMALALLAHNRRIPICKYLFILHPVYGKLIGVILVSAILLAPVLILSGTFQLTAPEFFWGGCFAYSAMLSFTFTCLTVHEDTDEEKREALHAERHT